MIDVEKLKIPSYSFKDIDAITQRILTSIGYKLPIDVELIAEKLYKLDLTPIEGIKNLSSTDAYLSCNQKEIAFDPNVPNVRIRFSIAHELGHLVLHSDLMKEIRFKDYSEWKQILRSLPGYFWGTVEKQANEFAGRLLAPRESIIQIIAEYQPSIKAAYSVVPDDIDSIREYLSIPLAKRFIISEDAMKIRLIKENLNPFDYK